ncbi:MAG: HD domain-containing protein [Bacilli bacterium]|nr:HD domain-containing protein [Bacilli bacterium]
MDKIKVFEMELNYIKNEKIKKSTMTMLELIPDYIFKEAASSTGKYHPRYALGDKGLVRHLKAAARFGYELLNDPCIGDKYTSDEKDLMIMGLILHDGLKRGLNEEKYTRFDHPILMANYIEENKDKLELNDVERELVCSVIKTHMGPWTTDYNGNEILEKPKTKYQNFVHMCDYLASRKAFLLEFDKDNNISC